MVAHPLRNETLDMTNSEVQDVATVMGEDAQVYSQELTVVMGQPRHRTGQPRHRTGQPMF
jgi:hypothetical protein